MYAGTGKQTDFAEFSVYEVKPPAPRSKRGWYWELKSTYESAGPFTYDEAVKAGRERAEQKK